MEQVQHQIRTDSDKHSTMCRRGRWQEYLSGYICCEVFSSVRLYHMHFITDMRLCVLTPVIRDPWTP